MIAFPLRRSRKERRRLREGQLLALAGLLVLTASAILIGEARMRYGKERIARDFQTLVHGTGLGPAADISECAFAFDPRLASRCSHDTEPIPLGGIYCSYHALSVFSYPALKTGGSHSHSP